MSIPQSISDAISQYNMLSDGDTVVIGVSGGADSIALLQVLYSIRNQLRLTIHAVHINHGLRGEDADNDQKFVEEFCQSRDIPCHSFVVNVAELAQNKGLSFEEAGRHVRYESFEKIAKLYNANKIATAHHMNDNCETVIHNILRGSGTTGLSGIHPVRGIYIRPFIKTSRNDIEEYLKSENIQWCTDKTNLDSIYTRNKIRLELIPYLKKSFNSSIESAITRLSLLCGDDDDYMHIQTVNVFNSICIHSQDRIILKRDSFNNEHIALKRRLIRYALEKLNIPLKDVHMAHIDNCLKFIAESESGSAVKISSCRVSIEQSGICFSSDCNDEPIGFSYNLEAGKNVFIKEISKIILSEYTDCYLKESKNVIYINADNITGPFEIRNRRPGDKITPFGMKGSKKLKDYFIDSKIDISIRNKIPLIVYNNEVVWIAGMAMSENYRITSDTKKILRIEIK